MYVLFVHEVDLRVESIHDPIAKVLETVPLREQRSN